MTDDGHGVPALDLVLGCEETPGDRMGSKNGKELRGHLSGPETLRFVPAFTSERDATIGQGRQAGEDVLLGAPVEKVLRRHRIPRRHCVVFQAALEDRDQADTFLERQWPEHHAVDDGEDRGGRADAQGQEDERDGREPGSPAERSRRVLQVTPETVQPHGAHIPHSLGRLHRAAEIAQRGPSRFSRRHATRDIGGGFLFDVIRELLARFGVCATPAGKSAAVRNQSAQHCPTPRGARAAWTARTAPSLSSRARAAGGLPP